MLIFSDEVSIAKILVWWKENPYVLFLKYENTYQMHNWNTEVRVPSSGCIFKPEICMFQMLI